MTTPLLKTKLYIPPIRSEFVSRPHLIERLHAGLQRKLTLISAPAGFGKTTLLSECVAGCGRSVAWLSLDEGDNDPARFLAYFIAALQTVQADLGQTALTMFQSSQPPPLESILTILINEIAVIPGNFALVLDDYHVIDAQPVHEALNFLLEHLPPQIHLIIASRVDPPLSLARLRARGQITELRSVDLRFASDEAAAFLNQMMGLDLSAEDVAALTARTEGWIAGLQLAAISMQEHQDMAGFIQAFTGSHRYILDYLTEEVLQQQPESVQSFLLQTSILSRLSGSLCDAVTGRDDSQATLEQTGAANLFILPLDDERCWYRYHHLFAELLQNQLRRTQPDSLPSLHRRASEWYAANRFIAEAVSHAVAAGDMGQAVSLIEENALAMMGRGELTTVVGWLTALPDKMVRSRPWLCVFYAWAMLFTGQIDAVEPHLQNAEDALDGLGTYGEIPLSTLKRREGEEADSEKIQGHIATIRAYVLGIRGDISPMIEHARQALECLREDDLMARGFAAALLGSGYRLSGNLVAASQALTEAIAISQAAGDSHLVILMSCNLAAQQIQQGQLRQAAATFQDVLKLADGFSRHGVGRLPITGIVSTGLASIRREWNDLQAAAHLAREGVELSGQWGQAEMMFHGYVELAQVLQLCGDEDGMLQAIQKAAQIARDLSAWFTTIVAAYRARLWLGQGDMTAASHWAQESGLSIDDELSFQHESLYRILARVLIAQGKQDEALKLLARLLEVVETAGAMGSVIEILVLQAVALQAQGMGDQALLALERALSLAKPEGYVRIFVGEGEPMAILLRQAATQGIYLEYVRKLLAALKAQEAPSKPISPSAVPEALIEGLSERELQVLRLIAAGLTNREIAEELYVSINTVKTHTKSIYSKLNSHNRTQAINRARELELL